VCEAVSRVELRLLGRWESAPRNDAYDEVSCEENPGAASGDNEEITTVSFLGQAIEIRRLGTGGDPDRAGACIAEYDGKVEAIALEGFARSSSSARSRASTRSALR